MSEEKLYAVKNDEGKYWDFEDSDGFWGLYDASRPITVSEENANAAAHDYGGHVVTFVEEPEKVVISKTDALRQGWLVARYGRYNPDAVSDILAKYKDEAWGMIDAYVSGYTVAKEKKYNVKVPKKWSGDNKHYWTKEQNGSLTWGCLINKDYMIPTQQFTGSEIERYGLQDCEKVEVDE